MSQTSCKDIHTKHLEGDLCMLLQQSVTEKRHDYVCFKSTNTQNCHLYMTERERDQPLQNA